MQKKLVLVSPTSHRLVELFGLEADINELTDFEGEKVVVTV